MKTLKIENIESFLSFRTEGYKEVVSRTHQEWMRLNGPTEEDIDEGLSSITRKGDEVDEAFTCVIRTKGAAWWKNLSM